MDHLYTYLWFILIGLFLTGAIFPYLLGKKKSLQVMAGCLAASAGCLIVFWLGLEGLFAEHPIEVSFGRILPFLEFVLTIDRLSGFFLVTISTIALFTSLYSIGYMKLYSQENLAWWSFCYNIFLLAMILVVAVSNIVQFLIFWEMMTLASYFLVTFSYKREQVRKAGFVYLVMTHIGTVFIASAFFLLHGSDGGWAFSDLMANASVLSPGVKNIIFICALIGFGTKAGIVPLHIWLPQAHPAAPTSVSALMSGVMLKTAIYGLVRLVISLLGSGPSWWGMLVIAFGIVSAVVGVISALMQHDLKRLLAFHSVENIGIILMGIGTSLVFYSWSMPVPAAIALAAALFHVLNHAIFKSLLFLSTGSVYFATHSKDIEDLGGLIKKMPLTAILFLIGSISISAIPPFNGFASEYQIYLSMLAVSAQRISGFWIIGGILGCTALALTGALAAACFVKAFGVSFLALPRSSHALKAKEVPLNMTLSIAPLALFCLVLGAIPGKIMSVLTRIALQLTGDVGTINVQTFDYKIFVMVILVMIVVAILIKITGASPERKSETWGCGIEVNAQMEYTAASFSQPIRRVYSPLLRPSRRITTEYVNKPYFGYRIVFSERIGSNIKDYLYAPVRQAVIKASRKWQFIQSGNINWYLGYIFATLIILLVFFSKG